MSRRDVLFGMVGMGAGLTAVLCGSCVADSGSQCQDAGPAQAASARTSPLSGIDTFVVVMMENRSFDHYLGALSLDPAYPAAHLVDGLHGNEQNPDGAGQPVRIYPLADEALASPPHDWDSAHAQFDAGKNDGFVRAYAGPAEGQCMGYYVREHLPVLYSLADQYTVCDRWFSSVMGSTWPNRFYLHAATSLGIRGIQPIAVGGPPTLWDRMRERCLSCRNYSAGPLSWYSGGFAGKTLAGDNPTAKIESFFSDAQAGTLPNFSLIDPDFHLNDDHPPRNIKFGQAFLASIYQALAASPQWSRSLLLIIYDEHGGFYDHVPPPQAVDDLPDFRQLGFRVPALVIGPTARRGAVDSTVREHVSVAATLATRFGIESLTPRMDAAADLSSCVDPTLAVRPPPTVPRVQVTAGEVAGVQVRSSQPELDRLVLAGQIPPSAVDPRPAAERFGSWLRLAQELDVLRVSGSG